MVRHLEDRRLDRPADPHPASAGRGHRRRVWPGLSPEGVLAGDKLQRCLVRVQRNVRTYLTMRLRTDAGKALRALNLALTRIRTTEEAARWQVKLHAWHQVYAHLVNAKTYLTRAGVRPAWARDNATWWWTRERLRKAYQLLARLVRQGVLFTYVAPRPDRPIHQLDDEPDRRRHEQPDQRPAPTLPRDDQRSSAPRRRMVVLPALTQPPVATRVHPARPLRPSTSPPRAPRRADRPRALRHRHQRQRRALGPQRLGRTLRVTPPIHTVLPLTPHYIASSQAERPWLSSVSAAALVE